MTPILLITLRMILIGINVTILLTKCQTPCEKIIHETKKNQGAEFAESVTTMYELMKELGVVRE
jgi:hypothetical protein